MISGRGDRSHPLGEIRPSGWFASSLIGIPDAGSESFGSEHPFASDCPYFGVALARH